MKRRFIVALLISLVLSAQTYSRVFVTGNFQNPDGSNLTGTIQVRLVRSSVTNTCITPAQVLTFQPVTGVITNGVLTPPLFLYATTCLNPSTPYSVVVYNSQRQVMYSTTWKIPNVYTIDVGQVDVKEQ